MSSVAGLYIRLLSECWSEKQDCAGYFPLGVGISNLLSWPIIVTERLAFGEHGFVSSYDAVMARYCWILVPVLWVLLRGLCRREVGGRVHPFSRPSGITHPTGTFRDSERQLLLRADSVRLLWPCPDLGRSFL
jgi:hypothetical protein